MISLPEQTNMILKYMRRLPKISRCFRTKGWLVQDEKKNYYVYAQTMNGKTQYGLVVGAYVPDYMNGVIKNMN